MSWCPHCRTEYIRGVTHCADCGAALVEELPPAVEPLPLEPVLLTTVTTNAEIAQLTGLLDSANIPYYGLDRGSGGYLRIVMGQSVYGQEIYVDRRRYDEANALLTAYCSRHQVMVFEDDDEAPPEPEADPGAWQFYVAVMAVFFLLFIYYLVTSFV